MEKIDVGKKSHIASLQFYQKYRAILYNIVEREKKLQTQKYKNKTYQRYIHIKNALILLQMKLQQNKTLKLLGAIAFR